MYCNCFFEVLSEHNYTVFCVRKVDGTKYSFYNVDVTVLFRVMESSIASHEKTVQKIIKSSAQNEL